MAELFVKRMRAAELVYAYKAEHGLPILDRKREAFVIASNSAKIEDSVIREFYIDYLKNLMSISRAYQYRLQNTAAITDSGEQCDDASHTEI